MSKIESELSEALGYEVAAIIRTAGELADIAHHKAFPSSALGAAMPFNIMFLAQPQYAKAKQKVMALKLDIDNFNIHGVRFTGPAEKSRASPIFLSPCSNNLCKPSTARGMNTRIKMVENYPGL